MKYQNGQATPIVLSVIINILIFGGIALVVFLINPIEKFNEKDDAIVQSTAHQYAQGLVAYFNKNNSYPWTSDGQSQSCMGQSIVPDRLSLDYLINIHINCTQPLVGNELSDTFLNLPEKYFKRITVSYDAPSNRNYICYQPKSDMYQHEKNTIYTDTHATEADDKSCISQGGTAKCYWCE